VLYDFKGAKLGMSLQDWKTLQPPVKEDGVAYAPLCDTEAQESDKHLFSYGTTELERSANVITCGYFGTGSYGIRVQASIPIGGLSASSIFYKFLNGKLYMIDIGANTEILSEVMDGLTAKWGAPSSTVQDTTQNRAGASFPHVIKRWENSASFIQLETPFERIDGMHVIYETNEGRAALDAFEKARHPSVDKM
jgi:hypothetical protein